MEKNMSLSSGILLVVLTLAGFVLNKKKLFRLMNVDINHSYIRIPLTLALLYGGTKADLKTTRKILLGMGIFYIFMGAAGTTDKKVGGLLPSRLTNFDLVYHFAVGATAVWLGARSGRMLKP